MDVASVAWVWTSFKYYMTHSTDVYLCCSYIFIFGRVVSAQSAETLELYLHQAGCKNDFFSTNFLTVFSKLQDISRRLALPKSVACCVDFAVNVRSPDPNQALMLSLTPQDEIWWHSTAFGGLKRHYSYPNWSLFNAATYSLDKQQTRGGCVQQIR